MRLSTSMTYQLNLTSITNGYSKWQNTGVQMATGLRVNSPADDPIASSQALGIQNSQSIGEQYAASRSTAIASLSLETTVLEQVTDAITSIQTLLVRAGDGTLSDDNRQALATELQSYKDQLVGLANSKDGNGNYIFAGYKTDSAPFVQDSAGKVTYAGGAQAITQQVDDSREMAIGDSGAQVFVNLVAGYTPEPNGDPSDANIFNNIDIALGALKTPQEDADTATKDAYAAAMGTAGRGLSNALNNVSTVQASVGSKLKELDTLDSVGTDRALIYQTRISDLTGADWNKTVSDYKLQEVALQAAYSVFGTMQKLSLFQLNS